MESLDNKARIIQEIANKLGWESDVESLIERVKQVDRGLVKEDEFIYLLNWLPNCITVNKLDQSAMPNSVSSQLGVTDLLAVFEINGEKKSFLIEVKTSKDSKLSWSEKYVNKLKSYSELTGMPILIAWKCTEFEFSEWVLFSIDDFKKPNKSYKIEYTEALKRNLLSQYAKDYYVALPENFAISLSFRKGRNVEKEENSEIWDTHLESLKLIGREEHNLDKLSSGLFALIICLGIEEETEVTNEHIIIKWKPYNTFMPVQKVPLLLNRIFTKDSISWIELIQNEKYPINYSDLFNDLKTSIDNGLVYQILFTIPSEN